jgi:SAM-dependent methyltransferase
MTGTGPWFGKVSRGFSWMKETVRNRGVATTLKIVISTIEDACFDWRHGTETSRVVDSDQFETTLANRAHAVRYKATRARPFLKLLRHLRLPEGSTFVDVGSGKGRVLLLASQLGFRRVVGVEFSPSLCEQARRNIEIFRRRSRQLSPIEVVQADITQHEWRGDENVFFLYNPFDAVILGQFVEGLRRSVVATPRQVWLIYSAPVHATVLGESGLFPTRKTMSFWGTEFHLYTNWRPDQAAMREGADSRASAAHKSPGAADSPNVN